MQDLAIEYSLDELGKAAEQLLGTFPNQRIFLFEAQMGAGKTTLIKELCVKLGSSDNFSSPTFAIVNNYSSSAGTIHHFDLYRIKGIEELYDLGFEEYLESGNYCFIEWPEIANGFFNDNFVEVKIEVIASGRTLMAKVMQ